MNIVFMLTGALVYRFRGGMPIFGLYNKRPVAQVLFALPYGWDVFIECGPILGFLCLVTTTITISRGHGNNMDLGDHDAGPEWYEPAIAWAKPHLSPYWYDVLGMAISGLTYTLPAGIFTLNPFLALSGVFKAPCYMLAKQAGAGTDGGELLTGAILWGSL